LLSTEYLALKTLICTGRLLKTKEKKMVASDIDLLILGHPDPLKLAAEISALEKTLKREVNYTVLKPSELKRTLEAHDRFLTDVWQGRKVELIRHEQDKTAAN
jgi:predicted nucleotidyltransferase